MVSSNQLSSSPYSREDLFSKFNLTPPANTATTNFPQTKTVTKPQQPDTVHISISSPQNDISKVSVKNQIRHQKIMERNDTIRTVFDIALGALSIGLIFSIFKGSARKVKAANLVNDIKASKAPENVKNGLIEELNNMGPFDKSEQHISSVLSLPWGKKTEDRLDIDEAKKIMDSSHIGHDYVKEEILKYMATRKLSSDPESVPKIICFVGSPGVGKTTIGQAIADAMGRKFERISLGGTHDEGSIKGFVKTYSGATPGKIISALKHADSSNPIIMLDEIDKLGNSVNNGSPEAALLEVLDSTQNKKFVDNYIGHPFDLSDTLFITTANDISLIDKPLLDRMKIIKFDKYSAEDKTKIIKENIFPKKLDKIDGLKNRVELTDSAIEEIVKMDANNKGLRNIENIIDEICSSAALEILRSKDANLKIKVTKDTLKKFIPNIADNTKHMGFQL